MSATLEEIAKSAFALPSNQRLALAGFLLELEDTPDSGDVAQAWEAEIQRRIQAVDSGSISGIPFSEVMREAENRLAP
jgi:hypothetical protein